MEVDNDSCVHVDERVREGERERERESKSKCVKESV